MIELNKIYLEDCIKTMARMSDRSINCVVTSPPYNLGGDFHTFVAGKRVTYGDYSKYKDKVKEEDYQQWQIEVLNECYRILKDDGVMFYNHKNRIVNGNVINPFEWLSKTNFNVLQVVVVNLRSTANVDKRRFFPVHELLFVLTKNKNTKLHNDDCLTDVWEIKKVSRKISGHPATFHVELPLRCIKAGTNDGEIVYDPFCGTGTVMRACVQTNRVYIGSEIDSKYIPKIDNNTEASC